ncbi:MAG TPA: neutral/alkaline non-lysosomal ceramidase N-terminal domain-containing protein [Phycisphaerae bacterium]|nr:neutral/alkaline non-lysosomal ceramidase N-terminal domain-containing protein [Phycisphaerae bacterium]
MLVGTAAIDITPKVGTELCGFLAREQPSTGVRDRLLARSLYLESGGRRLLWIHADVIGFDPAFVADVKRTIERRFELAADRVVLSATHTHSGPPTIHLINCGAYDPAYLADLKERLLDITSGATLYPEPAELVVAEGRCDLAVDRRGRPTTHTDPRVGIVGWRRKTGDFIAVLANYPIHHVALRADNRQISADMAGRAADTISRRLPGRPNVLFTNGACGNLNPPAVTSEFIQTGVSPGFTRMEQWGDALAEAVVTALVAAGPCGEQRLEAALAGFDLRFERFSADDVRRKARELYAAMQGKEGYVPDRYRDAISLWEQQAVACVTDSRATFSSPLATQVVRIGPVRFVCLGAEVFSRMADELRSRAAGPLYVAGYANGDTGYLVPESAYDEGGYEVESAFAFYGGLPAQRGEFERLRDMLVQILT